MCRVMQTSPLGNVRGTNSHTSPTHRYWKLNINLAFQNSHGQLWIWSAALAAAQGSVWWHVRGLEVTCAHDMIGGGHWAVSQPVRTWKNIYPYLKKLTWGQKRSLCPQGQIKVNSHFCQKVIKGKIMKYWMAEAIFPPSSTAIIDVTAPLALEKAHWATDTLLKQ